MKISAVQELVVTRALTIKSNICDLISKISKLITSNDMLIKIFEQKSKQTKQKQNNLVYFMTVFIVINFTLGYLNFPHRMQVCVQRFAPFCFSFSEGSTALCPPKISHCGFHNGNSHFLNVCLVVFRFFLSIHKTAYSLDLNKHNNKGVP